MSANAGLPTVLIIDTDPLWRAGVTALLSDDASTMQYSTLVDAFVAVPGLDPEVFVLGPNLTDQLEEIGPLTRANPHLAVVAVVDNATVEVLQEAVRNGVHDVVDNRVEANVARSAMESVEWARARRGAAKTVRRQRSHVVAVCSAKGGVGVTSIAINLATVFAQNRQQVAIADADPVFGDVAMFLGMPAPPPLPEHEVRSTRLNADDVLELAARHKGTGLTVLSPRQSNVPLHDFQSGLMAQVLSGLQQLTTMVVVDMPSPLTESIDLIKYADRVLLVAEHTPSSLKNTLVARKLMQQSGIVDATVDIVLNRVPRPEQVALYDLEQLFGTPVVGVLPEAPRLIESVEQQSPLVKMGPREVWSVEVARLAERVFITLNAG